MPCESGVTAVPGRVGCVADGMFLHALIGMAAIGHRGLDKFLCE